MRRHFGVIAAGVAAFLLVLIVRVPARWAALALPRGVACASLGGTLWSGTCGGLIAAGVPLGDLAWTLHPLRLLVGRLNVDIVLSRAGGSARGNIEISPGGAITARRVHADFALDRSLISALPPATHGSAEVDLVSLHWTGKRVTQIRGQIDVSGLTADRGEPLGNYRLSFPGGGGDEPVGVLSDLGGPFAVQGTVHLTRAPGFVVDGLVAARPDASPDLVSELRYLGEPDAQGRRQFRLEEQY